MRLFGRGGRASQGLSGEITRAWQDPLFHQQHPLAAALLQGLFPHLCPCTKVIPGNGHQTLFGQMPGMAGAQTGWPLHGATPGSYTGSAGGWSPGSGAGPGPGG